MATAVQSQTPVEAAQAAVASATKAAAEANNKLSFYAGQRSELEQQVEALTAKYNAACKAFAAGDGTDPGPARDELNRASPACMALSSCMKSGTGQLNRSPRSCKKPSYSSPGRKQTMSSRRCLPRNSRRRKPDSQRLRQAMLRCGSTAKPFSSSASAGKSSRRSRATCGPRSKKSCNARRHR